MVRTCYIHAMHTKRDSDILFGLVTGDWADPDLDVIIDKPSTVEIRALVVLGLLHRREVKDGVFAIEISKDGIELVMDRLAKHGYV